VQNLSEQAAERMRLHSAVGEGVELMQQAVLPTLPYLSRISAHDHQLVVEKIGSTWCNLLGLPLSGIYYSLPFSFNRTCVLLEIKTKIYG
jgi:hypothetical protein